MSSCSTNSSAASQRSQSQIRRWISGSDTLRRSRRGGKSPPGSPPPGLLLPLLPLLPHQEAVRQHHRHRVPVEARPQPPLVLIPTQQFLGLFVVLLHPVPPVRVAHQRLQTRPRPQVAPVVTALAVGTVLPQQPTHPPLAVGPHPPATHHHERRLQPTLATFAPADVPPQPRRLRPHHQVGAAGPAATAVQRHGEVAAHGDDVTLTPLLQ